MHSKTFPFSGSHILWLQTTFVAFVTAKYVWKVITNCKQLSETICDFIYSYVFKNILMK